MIQVNSGVKKKYKIDLTERELVTLSSQSAEIHKILMQVRFEEKTAKDGYKNKISGYQDDFSEIMTKVREKKEWRDLECDEMLNYELKTVTYMFEGQIMEERAMTDYELQLELTPKKER